MSDDQLLEEQEKLLNSAQLITLNTKVEDVFEEDKDDYE